MNLAESWKVNDEPLLQQRQATCHIFLVLRSLFLKTVKVKSNNLAKWVSKAKKMVWRFRVSSRSLRQWITQDPPVPLQENMGILTWFHHSVEFLHSGKHMMVQNRVSFPLHVAQRGRLSTFWHARRKEFSQWCSRALEFSLSCGTRIRLKCIDNKRLICKLSPGLAWH